MKDTKIDVEINKGIDREINRRKDTEISDRQVYVRIQIEGRQGNRQRDRLELDGGLDKSKMEG